MIFPPWLAIFIHNRPRNLRFIDLFNYKLLSLFLEDQLKLLLEDTPLTAAGLKLMVSRFGACSNYKVCPFDFIFSWNNWKSVDESCGKFLWNFTINREIGAIEVIFLVFLSYVWTLIPHLIPFFQEPIRCR